jgi:hypothetical protein
MSDRTTHAQRLRAPSFSARRLALASGRRASVTNESSPKVVIEQSRFRINQIRLM